MDKSTAVSEQKPAQKPKLSFSIDAILGNDDGGSVRTPTPSPDPECRPASSCSATSDVSFASHDSDRSASPSAAPAGRPVQSAVPAQWVPAHPYFQFAAAVHGKLPWPEAPRRKPFGGSLPVPSVNKSVPPCPCLPRPQSNRALSSHRIAGPPQAAQLGGFAQAQS